MLEEVWGWGMVKWWVLNLNTPTFLHSISLQNALGRSSPLPFLVSFLSFSWIGGTQPTNCPSSTSVVSLPCLHPARIPSGGAPEGMRDEVGSGGVKC